MERSEDIKLKYISAVLYIMFFVGIAGHLIEYTKQIMLFLTPFTLLLFGTMVLYPELKSKNKILLLWLISTYIMTFIIEAVGVKTGLIFGSYIYGDVLGLKILDVPLVIGLNWVVVIFGAYVIARKMFDNIWLKSLTAGILSVLFDFILEPAAVKLGYWIWSDGIIPLQNYIAWFVISFVFAWILSYLKYTPRSSLAIHYYNLQIIFFVALGNLI